MTPPLTPESALIAFLNARLDEDEAMARAAAHLPGRHWDATDGGQDDRRGDGILWDEDHANIIAWFDGHLDTARHAALHDPARVLREVVAKRAILDRHMPHQPAFGDLACNWCSDDVDDRPQIAKERWPCPDVRSLAAVYSDHPDYRPSGGSAT